MSRACLKWGLALCSSIALLAGCDSPHPLATAVAAKRPINHRLRAMLDTVPFTTGAVIGTYNNSPQPGDEANSWTTSIYNAGIQVQPYAMFSVSVTGSISIADNPQYTCCFIGYGIPDPLAGLTVTPAGTTADGGYDAIVSLLLDGQGNSMTTSGDSVYFGPYQNSRTDSKNTVIGFARTGMGPETSCGSEGDPSYTPYCTCPCNTEVNIYTITGTETMTVYRYADQISVGASTTTGTGATSVTFTVSTNDAGSLYVYPWTWQPDVGTDTLTTACSSYQVNPCTTTVYQSGVMSSTSYDYGAARWEETGVHITIN